tara:strand:- start:1770 stop:2945 length:1176 start_codon:yes stop_codon:yes gene_type:complete
MEISKSNAKVKLKELVKEVITEIIGENHNFKVGDEVKFNGDHDGVVVKVHTSGKLKGHIDVQKKGRSSTVTLFGGNKREVRLAEDISENEGLKGEGANINPKILTPTEIQLAVGVINFFGTGSHPMADAKGLKYFKIEYLSDLIYNNRKKLTGEAKKHLSKLLGKLQKSIKEDSVTENKDINFVLDQLANAVDLYPKDEFAKHMADNTKYDEKSFEKLYDAYFKMKAMDRFHMATDINKSKKFLKKFGINEEVQTLNEGVWSGIKTRESGVKGWKGNTMMAWGSGTSFQQILWLISPKEGHLSRYQWDADGNIKQKECHADCFDTGQYGLKLFYEHNKDAGLDIEKDFPFKEVNRMRKAYRRLGVEMHVKMATDTTHKLAMKFLAKYGIKP